MRKVKFIYKGAMLEITGKLNEQFAFPDETRSVRDALNELNKHYGCRLKTYIEDDIFLVVSCDGESRMLLFNYEQTVEKQLGKDTTIGFYERFVGG